MKKIVGVLFAFVLCLLVTRYEVSAEGPGFAAKPVLPDNQKEGTYNYFDLKMEPKQKQTVYVDIHNLKKGPLTLKISATNALTAKNGGIYYDVKDGNETSSFIDKEFAVAKYIEVEEEIHFKANETKRVPVTITLPDKDRGTYLGGIQFYDPNQNKDTKTEDGKEIAVKINNEYTVTMAIQADMPKKDDTKEIFKFGNAEVEFTPSGIMLNLGMENHSKTILKEVEISYKIKNKNGDILFTDKVKDFKMAPKTKIKYPVRWDSDNIKEGKYTVDLVAKIGDKEIKETREFEIKPKAINQYIQDNKEREKPIVVEKGIPWYVWVLIAGGFVFFFWLGKRRNKKKEE